MTIARYLAIAGVLFLAACASDDRGRQVELPPTLDTVLALLAANQETTLGAASQAANSLHSPDTVNTTFDGQQYTVLINRQNASDLTFDTETDEVFSDELAFPIVPGHAP